MEIILGTITSLKKVAHENYSKTLTSGDKKPQIALLIAFIRLLTYADRCLNNIPQRYLDYYYRNILQFSNRPAASDHAYLHFKLKKDCPYYFLPAGVRIMAKDRYSESEIFYKTNREITLNQGSIGRVNVFHDTKHQAGNSDMPSCVKLVAATYSEALLDKGKQPLFPIVASNQGGETRAHQYIATLISSPIFYLKEGKRNINLSYKFTQDSFLSIAKTVKENYSNAKDCWKAFTDEIVKLLRIEFTTKLSWFVLPASSIKLKTMSETFCLQLTLEVVADMPPITNFNSAVHSNRYQVKAPAIRIGVQDDISFTNIYALMDLVLEKVDIRVQVNDYRGAVLQNELGLIDSTQVFQPFGPMPKQHANFYIGSDEIFGKNLKNLQINVKWEGLPKEMGGLKKYYEGYPSKLNNTDYNLSISYLNHQQWHPFYQKNREKIPLFTIKKDNKGTAEWVQDEHVFQGINLDLLGMQRENKLLDASLYTPHTLAGFLKLQLTGPEMAFGHAIYPRLMSEALIKSAKKNKNGTLIEINPPYTPTIRSLSINYTAQESMILNRSTSQEEKTYHNHFLHLTPFGYRQVFPGKMTTPTTLIPYASPEESYFCFGIKNMNGNSVSLHIQVGEQSMHVDTPFLVPSWQYLSHNRWLPLKEEHIIADGTDGLVMSGILILEIPHDATANNTYMDPGFIWIRATFSGSIDGLPTIIGIYAQAIAVTRKEEEVDNNGVRSPTMPPYSITNIVGNAPEIEAVLQPFNSEGGGLPESDNAFYTRVSERLRHKNRAVSPWDYERLILEKFPAVFRVKCVNHTQKEQPHITSPGHITIVVIGKLVGNGNQGTFPNVSRQLLAAIKKYLQTVASPFIQFDVINPTYEDVKINVTLKIKKGYEKGLVLSKLQKEIRNFISPWLFNATEDITLGGSMPTSKVIDFIGKRKYVEGIGSFSILKYAGSSENLILSKVTDYDSYLKATYPWSVMVAAKHHKIAAVNNFDTTSQLRHGGLGDMAIGEDFLIGPWDGFTKEEYNDTLDNRETKLVESLEDHYLLTKKNIQKDHGNN